MTGLTQQGRELRHDAVCFCTHCGAVTDDAPQRVCPACGLGVVLSCAREAAPRPGAAFLVVTSDLRISAAATATGTLLGDAESLVGERLLDHLRGDGALPRQIARAAMGSGRASTAWVRTIEQGRPLKAAIAACGSPPAALVVLS